MRTLRKRRNAVSGGLIAALAIAVGGCGSTHSVVEGGRHFGPGGLPVEVRARDPRAFAGVTSAEVAELRDGNAVFAGRLLALLGRGRSNVALSPFSASEAIAMLYAGARGETASQIAHALDFRLPPQQLHAAFNAADRALAAANGPQHMLEVANTLFGQRGEHYRQAFLALLARDYGAGMQTVDFSRAAQDATAAINRWVSDRTHGKIPELLSPQDVDALTRLVLVNAVYLHAKWLMPFTKRDTSPAPFHSPSGTVTVSTMHQTAQFDYLRGSHYQALELPYQGGRLALDILLPDAGQLPALLRRLASRGPLQLLHGLRPRQVKLSLPKLKLQTRFELRRALSNLGMALAFRPSKADLSGITGPPGYLHVHAVVQEAYLHVDEAGTEATAATAVVIDAVSTPIVRTRFNVDRPFIFVLRDLKTGAILFLGTVAHP